MSYATSIARLPLAARPALPRVHWQTVAGAVALIAVAGGMIVWTWQCWADPLVDFGRECYMPWQMLHGARLYRDLAYFNGPLSPCVNTAVFAVLGASLRSLYLANAVVLLAINWLLWRLLQTVGGRRCAWACLMLFWMLFACGNYVSTANYNYLAPYSHEMTHGLLLALVAMLLVKQWIATGRRRWAVGVGLMLGLLLLTKPEIAMAAMAACVAALVLASRARPLSWGRLPTCQNHGRLGNLPHDRRHRTSDNRLELVKTVIAAMGGSLLAVVPAAIWLVSYLPLHEAIRGLLGAWPQLLNQRVTGMMFYRLVAGLQHPGTQTAIVTFWFCVQLIIVRFACRAALPDHVFHRRWDILLAITAGVMYLAEPSVAGLLNFFTPLPLWLVVIGVVAVVRTWREPLECGDSSQLSAIENRLRGSGKLRQVAALQKERFPLLASLAVFALALLAKIILNVRICHYGFVLAMPGVMLCVVGAWQLGEAIRRRGGRVSRYAAVMGLLLLLGVGPHLAQMAVTLTSRRAEIAAANASLRTTPAKAAVWNAALAKIAATVKSQQTLAVWPQGAMVNFLTARPNPTPYIVLMPPELEMFGEDAVLMEYRRHPPDYVLLFACDTAEYGRGAFGAGYARQLAAWLRAHYRRVEMFGRVPLQPAEPGAELWARNGT
jgi:hypothetical protein